MLGMDGDDEMVRDVLHSGRQCIGLHFKLKSLEATVTLCLMRSGEQLPELSEKTGASADDRGPAAKADQTETQGSGYP